MKINENKFNLWFNAFILIGMLLAVVVTNVYKFQQPGARHFMLLLASVGALTGVINTVLHVLHLPSLKIINTPYAIVLGMIYNFLPFMLLPIYNSLIKVDIDVIQAAEDLGANKFQTFTKVIFPLTLPGVISGITMVFVPAMTTFVLSDLLGGSKILLIGNVIEQQFKQVNNWHMGSGLSLVLMIFIAISMAIMNKYDKEGKGASF